MEWMKNLSHAVDYIEENLDSEISYQKAAWIACCSPFYFQRIFSYVAGISLSEYIRRRRMTQAAFELQSGNEKIQDIGTRYGYVSPASFNRAFHSVHGVSPSAGRLPGTELNAYPRIKFSISITGGDSMKYRIEHRQALRLVGIKTALCEDNAKNQKICSSFWRSSSALLPDICRLTGTTDQTVRGVSCYRNPNDISYYIAAQTDAPVPDGMEILELPSSEWAVFSCDGKYLDTVHDAYRRFYTEWLPFSGYQVAETADMEIYPISHSLQQSGRFELWIAICREQTLH